MLSKKNKELFVEKYSTEGSDYFYKFLINYAVNRITDDTIKNSISPELELLNYYETFVRFYRQENDHIYLDIAKVFRKASHKVYRILRTKGITEKSNKFLNLVK